MSDKQFMKKKVLISCFLEMMINSLILLLHILSNGRFHPINNDFSKSFHLTHEVQPLLIM